MVHDPQRLPTAPGGLVAMFNSQTAIAYNTAMVKDPPATYAELERWVTQNSKKFGYNGIKGGMSGVSWRRARRCKPTASSSASTGIPASMRPAGYGFFNEPGLGIMLRE
jgi:hypothetical protein